MERKRERERDSKREFQILTLAEACRYYARMKREEGRKPETPAREIVEPWRAGRGEGGSATSRTEERDVG